jgi:WhiB family redox-sensing transcriptional regulator
MAKNNYAPHIIPEKEPWIKDANCRDTDPKLFYPAGEGKWFQPQIEVAKQICAGCKVVDICLKTALVRGELGIWGGTTENERRKLIVNAENQGLYA